MIVTYFLLQLMTPDFEIGSSSNAIGPVLAAVYNDNIGEVGPQLERDFSLYASLS